MNLDELEAKARAAKDDWPAYKEALKTWDGRLTTAVMLVTVTEFKKAVAELDPDTVLDLVERVRAGEQLYEALTGHAPNEQYRTGLALGCDWWLSTRDRAALDRWESLAHSPQEAGRKPFCRTCHIRRQVAYDERRKQAGLADA